MKTKILWLLPVLLLAGCFGGGDEEPNTPVVIEDPVYTEPDRPNFNPDIDEEDAFDQALTAIPADQIPRFTEVVDEGDADKIKARSQEEIRAAESEEDKAARAESEAKALAREQNQDGRNNKGLEFRQYSKALFNETKGVRAAIIYFTADDCEVCNTWETELKAQAQEFADLNALIMMVDFNAQPELVEEMRIDEPGQGMILTGIGELMGPRNSERLSKDDLMFIFL